MKKDNLSITKKHRMENIETENINQVQTSIPTKNITELNKLIYAGAKLVCAKIRVPLKSTQKNQNQDRKLDWKGK